MFPPVSSVYQTHKVCITMVVMVFNRFLSQNTLDDGYIVFYCFPGQPGMVTWWLIPALDITSPWAINSKAVTKLDPYPLVTWPWLLVSQIQPISRPESYLLNLNLHFNLFPPYFQTLSRTSFLIINVMIDYLLNPSVIYYKW